MKQFSNLLMAATISFLFSACNNGSQNDAKNLAEQIQSTVKSTTPGSIATSENGNYMKATINGKPWVATHMMEYETVVAAARIVGEKDEEYIGIPIRAEKAVTGKKEVLSEDYAIDLSYDMGDNSTWGGYAGEYVITKANDQSIEGTFFFTATSSRSAKSVEVTDGYFRLPRSVKKVQ